MIAELESNTGKSLSEDAGSVRRRRKEGRGGEPTTRREVKNRSFFSTDEERVYASRVLIVSYVEQSKVRVNRQLMAENSTYP